jgi:AcrR family transcriptional regulator
MKNNTYLKKSSNYHHGNLKEEMLKLSLETILNEGVDTLTLKLLGDKLGTSRSAIYRHFSSKQDLIQNVIAYGFQLFEKELLPILYKKDTLVIDRLYSMGESYINFAIKNPNLYRVLFGEKYQDIRESSCTINDEEQEDSFKLLIELLIEGANKEVFKIENPFMQAQTIHAMVHGISILYIDGHINIQKNIKELYDVSFNLITQGILKK